MQGKQGQGTAWQARKWLTGGSRQMIGVQGPYCTLGQPGGRVRVLAIGEYGWELHSYLRSNIPVRLPLERKQEAQKLGCLMLHEDYKRSEVLSGLLYCPIPTWQLSASSSR